MSYHNFRIEYNSFCTGEHVGTHIDAPAHFAQGKWKVHEIPAERFIGPGVIINVKSEAAANNDYRVTVDDLMIWEAANGRIPHNAFVIMNSGWGSRFPNVSLVLNSDDLGNATSYHFPGFHGDAARWLLANRNVSMLGVDTPSVDYAQTHDFDVHVVLYANNVPGLENVAYLDQVPDAGAMIYAFPLKLEHGSGSPVRIVAITDDKVPISRCFIVQWSSLASLLSVGMCIMLY